MKTNGTQLNEGVYDLFVWGVVCCEVLELLMNLYNTLIKADIWLISTG